VTIRIEVDIQDDRGRKLVLELGRDSENLREYWVFSQSSEITRGNEIGRVTSSLFDRY
jgi:hypothetical protein